MAGITLRTARQVVPMIYAYTTPEIARHNSFIGAYWYIRRSYFKVEFE